MALSERLREVPRVPVYVHVAVAVVIIAAHVLTMPVEFSFASDIFLEGVYLGLVVVLALYVRQLEVPLLELGWMVFAHARLVDFLDELYAEPNPWVNPYLGGVLTIAGLVILIAGVIVAIERRRERVERLEERTEQLTLLNRIVRHDIRNQSMIVGTWASELGDRVDPDLESDLDRIQRANRATISLTETAQDVVEVIRGDEETALEPQSLPTAVEDAVSTREAMYDEATIVVEDVPEVAVRADDLLPSLFRNLLDNAVQHNDRPEPTVEVTGERTDQTATVVVADDGPGLSEREVAALERAEGTDHLSESMGLYFIRTLVDRYGGDIEVDSGPDRGTRIAVSLPVSA